MKVILAMHICLQNIICIIRDFCELHGRELTEESECSIEVIDNIDRMVNVVNSHRDYKVECIDCP